MDLQTMINGFQALARNFIPIISGVIGMVAGLIMVGSAVVTMIKMGEPQSRDGTWLGAGTKLFIGAMLLQFTATMQGVSGLLFGGGIQDYHGALAYMPMPANNGGFWKQVLEICLIWVVMLGWVGAFRGFLQWAAAANGSGQGNGGDYFWKGVWHIVGGACAINVTGFIQSFLGR